MSAKTPPAATLVAVPVDGWTLFRQGEGFLVRDLDLAGQAELGRPRDVRPTIAGAGRDGLFPIISPGDPTPEGAYALAVPEVTPIGSGAHREVTAYYLNREAALHVVMRLRTAKAVALQVAIVRVFLRAVEGPPMPPALVPKASGKPLTQKQAEIVEYLRAYSKQFGTAPSYREIAAHFGWTSTNAVAEHLAAIERKGAIRLRGEGKARGIVLPPEPQAPAHPAPTPSAAVDRIDRLERLVEQLVGAVAMLVARRPRGGGNRPPPSSMPLPFPA